MTKYNDRFVYIMEEFSQELSKNIVKQLFDLDNKNKRPITLLINSEGGDCAALFAIHDVTQIIKSEIVTICVGQAYSAAACLLVSGSKGKRFITRNSDIMFHEVSSRVKGSYSSIKDELQSLEHYNTTIHRIIEKNINIPLNKLYAGRRDAYFSSEEALKIGAVDYIVDNIEDIFKYINPT